MSSPDVLGAVLTDGGVNVAVHAPDATAVAVCFFDAAGRETGRHRLSERTGGIHHGFIPGIVAGTRYGLRARGPWDPANGMRFNPAKLLVDPWATAIDRPFQLHDLLFDRDTPRPEDTASSVPKGIVGPLLGTAAPVMAGEAARTPSPFGWDRQVIYELHVRGFTKTHPDIPPAIRGTYAGLAHPAAIAHLQRLGIATVEIMPSAAWIDERHLPPLGLTNYWGYNPVAFLAPDPRLAPGGWAEIRAATDALHKAGIAVILDVVLNHSGESDEFGPTLSLRGLDNAGYYRLAADRSRYANDAGCGNVLALDRPVPLRLAMDSLRAWAVYGGMDGFRLDLATTLARRDTGFDPNAPLLMAMEQDPVLSRLAIIAEPWDIGLGGYQLGQFPARWGEWNDRYRDTMRRFWRGDGGTIGEFATRLAGSTDVFGNRPLNRGINFIAAHDGFTLADLVTYESKRNEANGEQNRDGTDDNISWNAGDEKTADVKALLATLLLSRGTPMVSMGDELGRTQHGNNNAYAQDNALAWIDWAAADDALIAHTAGLIALRRDLAPLFGGRPLTGAPADGDTEPDVSWHAPDGRIMTTEDWQRHDNRTLIAVLSAGGVTAALVFHAGREPVAVRLPWSETPLSIAARSVTVHKRSQPARGIRGGNDDRVHHLAERAGIQPDWWDVDGGHHAVPLDTKRALLDALRLPSGSATDIRDSLHRLTHKPPLPPALTVRANQPVAVELGVPGPAWLTLRREDGSLERFNTGDGRAVLPPQPAGRHLLLNEDRPERPCRLTVAPAACYLPPDLAAGERRFGIAAHLYALRSAGDRGIGDFTTLTAFARRSAAAGAATIGLNPLHAMFGGNRSRVSPYQPSDRRFIDPVYIDVSVFAGGQGRPPVPGPVDYPGVWAHKRAILRNAFRFDPNEPIAPGLLRFATHEAIAEQHGASWPSWPAALQHPDNPAVAAFAGQHREEIAFHAWMQRVADGQLAAAAADNGLTIGFYRDLAVGAAPDGAEAWSAQDVLMRGVSVGAPPDPFSAQGQVWCLPPPDPVAMRAEGYRGFAELLEANMRHAGALRIDHVMGLRRLFVVPDGASATEGAYIAYPMDDLLGQVALESQKARCLVVGEDLGTVPEGMAEALSASNILSYSVLWFERRDGQIRPPPEWRRLAAACVSTHDLPTLAGWWSGADIAEKQSLGLTDDPGAMTARAQEKQALIAMLQAEGLLDLGISPDGPMPMDFAVAVHRFVAATPSLLTLIQAGDLAGETVAVNLPGTDTERPNWRRRLDPAVDALFDAPLARAILGSMAGRDDRG